jgi:hypothetical protein
MPLPSTMIVELYCPELGEVISSITVPNGSFACLTGVIDLPAGDHTICIRMRSSTTDGWGSHTGASLQVVLGQEVLERGCIVEGGGGGCG